ncbi:MAG TPA: hypothetical protein ENO08_04990 [Candidatus Eisenbacteria bacterium]|uniref:Uncharacterized protein n=1 Tax=Eiseniibacteriota bacterium TaxID=2212470 RepID=A0A7V2AV14_UNCEI|nr:hypothetical protein [Candidatus Eisenbacteria bacterium]
MARWATLVEKRRGERPVMLIDAGDFCSVGATKDKEIKDRYFFEAVGMLGYDAMGIAENEILFGRANLEEVAKRKGLPLVSANILDKASGEPIVDRYVIRRIGGGGFLFFRSGGIKIGVFSVAEPSLVYGADRLVTKYYEVLDPRIAALEAASDLRGKGCDMIVALSHREWDLSVELARSTPGIDIVVASHSSTASARSLDVDGVLVVATGSNRTTFAEIEAEWHPDGARLSLIEWDDELLGMEDHPAFAELEKKFEKETGKTDIIKKIK